MTTTMVPNSTDLPGDLPWWGGPAGPPRSITETASRLGVAFVCAFLIGIERQLSIKPIGFGTFSLVCTAACAVAQTALSISETAPLPLMSGVLTGVGFLGSAGLVKAADGKTQGLLTAALMWSMASLGIALGAGLFRLAGVLYATMVFIVVCDRLMEWLGFGIHSKRFDITVRLKSVDYSRRDYLRRAGLSVDADGEDDDERLTKLINSSRDLERLDSTTVELDPLVTQPPPETAPGSSSAGGEKAPAVAAETKPKPPEVMFCRDVDTAIDLVNRVVEALPNERSQIALLSYDSNPSAKENEDKPRTIRIIMAVRCTRTRAMEIATRLATVPSIIKVQTE